MVLPPPPLLPLLSVGREDDTCSTNADSSLTTFVHAVFWALKAHALLDQPLLACCTGGKDGKGNCGDNNGTKLDRAQDWNDPPLLHPKQRWDGVEDAEQVKSKTTKRAIATAMRVVSNNNSNGDGGKSNGNGNKGGEQVTAMRAMGVAMTVTVAGDDEGDCNANEGGRQQ